MSEEKNQPKQESKVKDQQALEARWAPYFERTKGAIEKKLNVKTAKKNIITDELSGQFNVVSASRVLPFVLEPDLPQVVKKIAYAVKPGGYFVGHFFGSQHPWKKNGDVSGIEKEQVVKLLSPAFKKHEIEESIEEALAASGEKVSSWHEFTVFAQISKAGPFWSIRQMIQGLNPLVPGFKWRGDASKDAAWVFFSDKTSRDEALVCIKEMLSAITPATLITAQPARSADDRFAVMLMGITKEELSKYADQPSPEPVSKSVVPQKS